MLKDIKDIIILLLIAIIVVTGIYIYKTKSPKEDITSRTSSSASIRVHVIEAKEQPVTLKQTYIGYVTPIHSVSIHPMISGYIEKIFVNGGEDVKENQPLFILQQNEYIADLESAQAKTEQARATYMNAQTYYDRMLHAGSKAVSQTDLDNAKTSLLSAQAELTSALAAQNLAKINLGYTVINAPFSGIIGDVSVSKGDYVSPASSALLNIIQYTPIRVVFSISDKDYLNEISSSNQSPFHDWTLTLQLADGSLFEGDGKVQFLNNEITPQTSSISVYADFDNPHRKLISGAYVTVILQKTINHAILIPQAYVHLNPSGNFVYTVKNGYMVKTPVKIGSMIDNHFFIEEGLKKGEQIIADTNISFNPHIPIQTNIKE